jgi:Raf kinase inhibitor-like YbhB/YbcL family protein
MVRNFPSWLGKLLKNWRPGIEKTVFHEPEFAAAPEVLTIASSAFGQSNPIGLLYTDDGNGISPPLEWDGVPSNALSLVLIIEDADSPTPKPFVHALAWDISSSKRSLDAGSLKSKTSAGDSLKLGRNGLGKAQYTPPDPLPGHGQHRYVFQVFALDQNLDFQVAPNRETLRAAMRGHVLCKGVLVGIYERP